MSTPSLLSLTPSALIDNVPAAVAVTRGVVGTSGALLPPLTLKRARPCWLTPFSWASSPPTNTCVPSVARTCGPTVVVVPVLPPFILGVQCPSRPSEGRKDSRRYQTKLFELFGPTKPPAFLPQSWLCDPRYAQPFANVSPTVPPRHG